MNLNEFQDLQGRITSSVLQVERLTYLQRIVDDFCDKISDIRTEVVATGISAWSIKDNTPQLDDELDSMIDALEILHEDIESGIREAKRRASTDYRLLQKAIFCPDEDQN